MLNEFVYCPRLFALEWLHGQWAENADTVDGSRVHRRVDTETTKADFDGKTRSVSLSDEGLQLTARIDLLDELNGEHCPVDTKRGRPAPTEHRVWDPERVQLCAQGLLLRAHGMRSNRGFIWFAEARTRVEVPFTSELVEQTLVARDAAVALAQRPSALPEPLVDSPKCPRCSLVGICMPDETNHLRGLTGPVRPLLPSRDDREVLYVQLRGGRLGKSHSEMVVKDRAGEVGRAPIPDTSQVVLHGNVSVTTPLIHELMRRDVPVCFHGYGGWFHGMAVAATGNNVFSRIAQHERAGDGPGSLALARAFVEGKILNQRVMLRRNGDGRSASAVQLLKNLARSAAMAEDLTELLGFEGMAARVYFERFPDMLREDLDFDLDGRNRRPPKDPVNALLSFGYACLVRECTVALHRIGLDPYVGFLHRPRHGRPALALDLMEEFRAVLVDSAVLSAVNQRVVTPDDFVRRSTGVALTPGARRSFIGILEQRLDQEIIHPIFGTRWTWRRTLEVQARLLAKVLLGEVERYPAMRVR